AASGCIGTPAKAGASPGACEVESGGECGSSADEGVALASTALLAVLAFIAAASCARRSGERLSLFFVFLMEPDFSPAACAGVFCLTDGNVLVAGGGAIAAVGEFLAPLSAFSASIASSFRLSLVSFF